MVITSRCSSLISSNVEIIVGLPVSLYLHAVCGSVTSLIQFVSSRLSGPVSVYIPISWVGHSRRKILEVLQCIWWRTDWSHVRRVCFQQILLPCTEIMPCDSPPNMYIIWYLSDTVVCLGGTWDLPHSQQNDFFFPSCCPTTKCILSC